MDRRMRCVRWIGLSSVILLLSSLGACGGDGGESADGERAQTKPVPLEPGSSSSQYPVARSLTHVAASATDPRPEYLVPTTESLFATTLIRVSDQTAFATSEPYLRHPYAKNQPWNADGSLVMLAFTYPAAILDGSTYEFKQWFYQPSHAVWSYRDSDLMFGTHSGTSRLVRAHVSRDGEHEVIHEFAEYSEISFGAGEGNVSNDDRLIALFGYGGDQTDLLVFDLVEGRTTARLSFGSARVCDCSDPSSINNATVSQSGRFVVVQYNERGFGRYKGVEVFDSKLQFIRQLTPGSEHGDVGLTVEEHDVWVAYRDSSQYDPLQNAGAYAWRLDSGEAVAVIPSGTTGGHISCRNTRRPGYCYASHALGAQGSRILGSDQVYAFPLDGSMRMQVFARQRASSREYLRQPMAVPNPEGTKVLWASDWNDAFAPVHTYIASALESAAP